MNTRTYARSAVFSVVCTAICIVTTGCAGSFDHLPEIEYTWTQDKDPPVIRMIPTSDGFCYLTKISGNFRGDGEIVHVGVQTAPLNQKAYWELDGTSGSDSVTATAACSFWLSYDLPSHDSITPPMVSAQWVKIPTGPPYPNTCCLYGFDSSPSAPPFGNGCVDQVQVTDAEKCGTLVNYENVKPPAEITLSKGPAFCYLSGIQGKFNGAGELARVKYRILHAESQTEEGAVSATGACVVYATDPPPPGAGSPFAPPAPADPRESDNYSWVQGQPGPTNMIAANEGVCYLTAISGNLRGHGEWVQVIRGEQWASTPQQLTGHSEQNDVRAEARCFRYGSIASARKIPPPRTSKPGR